MARPRKEKRSKKKRYYRLYTVYIHDITTDAFLIRFPWASGASHVATPHAPHVQGGRRPNTANASGPSGSGRYGCRHFIIRRPWAGDYSIIPTTRHDRLQCVMYNAGGTSKLKGGGNLVRASRDASSHEKKSCSCIIEWTGRLVQVQFWKLC